MPHLSWPRTLPHLAVLAGLCVGGGGVAAVAMDGMAQQGVMPISQIRIVANDGGGQVAVLYPDLGEPYRSVLSQIILGITDTSRLRVTAIALGPDDTPEAISSQLKRMNIHTVIALGRHGLKATASLGSDVTVIAGAVVAAPEALARGMTVFSLVPEPGLLFARLKSLMPAARRVVVVYDSGQTGWLIRRARAAAAAAGLELIAYEAADLKSALRQYQEILPNTDPHTDALWLPPDTTTTEETSILPYVLEESWNHGLAVFSSNVGHVRRGVLFSLYPNNEELGRSMGDFAVNMISSSGTISGEISLLHDVLVAVNTRTAAHLGLTIGDQQLHSFDMVFPEY